MSLKKIVNRDRSHNFTPERCRNWGWYSIRLTFQGQRCRGFKKNTKQKKTKQTNKKKTLVIYHKI